VIAEVIIATLPLPYILPPGVCLLLMSAEGKLVLRSCFNVDGWMHFLYSLLQ